MDYKFLDKVVLRTPLLRNKTNFTVEELTSLFQNDEIREALYLSSPSLLSEFEKALAQGTLDQQPRIVHSLLKYALRMHNRCTPFGLYASCGVSKWGSQYFLKKTPTDRNTRLDMMYIFGLTQALASKDSLKSRLRFFPNTSCYSIQGNIRFVEYYSKQGKRVHQLCEVKNSDYLSDILSSSKVGLRISELVQNLVSKDISTEEANEFVSEIIECQLLVSELDIAVTGMEPLDCILMLLESKDCAIDQELEYIYRSLSKVRVLLNELDSTGGKKNQLHEHMMEILDHLGVEYLAGKIFQTDLFHKVETQHMIDVTIEADKNNLLKAVRVLNKLTPSQPINNLSNFKAKFTERYDSQEISLCEALDAESGIGYGEALKNANDINPLIDDLPIFSKKNRSKGTTALEWNSLQSFLLKKLHDNRDDQSVIVIDEEELVGFENNWDDLPASMSILYKHIEVNDQGNQFYLRAVGGSSAINLLGRFSCGNKEVEALVSEIATMEKDFYENSVIAQICHLPESRIGNVLFRASIREFEIPFLCKPSLESDNVITVDDLYISVVRNKIVLRSKRLNKAVIPRLDNAHTFSRNALPLYHFLCDFQTQDLRSNLTFNWGSVLQNEFKFLPRVRVGNIILSLGTWQLQREELEPLIQTQKANDQTKLNLVINQFKIKYNLPSIFGLVESDTELVINLNDELNVAMFILAIKNRPFIKLREVLFDEETAIVRDNFNKPYNNEIISVLVKDGKGNTTLNPKFPIEKKNNSLRSFEIGSEWLYFKFYCGIKNSDNILTNCVHPLCEELISEGIIDYWFFIRYTDPENHLRVRFHIKDIINIGYLIRRVYSQVNDLQRNGTIWKTQMESYKREIERYGELTIELAEQLFFYDSMRALKVLFISIGDDEIRWKLAILSIDNMLNRFKVNHFDRHRLLENIRNSFSDEFGIDKYSKAVLDKKYRLNRQSIYNILKDQRHMYSIIELDEITCLNEDKIIESIKMLNEGSQKLRFGILSSFIHMSLNRLFRNKQRRNELVIYDFLSRFYKSEIARNHQSS